MVVKITGKTYHSVRISLLGKNFDTPKRGQQITREFAEIPIDLIQLKELGIIKLEII